MYSKNSPDSFSSSWSSVYQVRSTWVSRNAWTHGINAHRTPSIYPASHDPNNVGAYFLTNSLRSTDRKYCKNLLLSFCKDELFSHAITCDIYEYGVRTKWALNPYGIEDELDYKYEELIQFGHLVPNMGLEITLNWTLLIHNERGIWPLQGH